MDGEIVASDECGKPSFNTLQNQGSSGVPLVYLIFGVMILAGRDVTKPPLEERQRLLETKLLPIVVPRRIVPYYWPLCSPT